jgi:hypothetical protein
MDSAHETGIIGDKLQIYPKNTEYSFPSELQLMGTAVQNVGHLVIQACLRSLQLQWQRLLHWSLTAHKSIARNEAE